ncbi:tail fiber protein [Pseudomonas phage 201phi2-1]|uniref:Virion structural protein n=1 Tax=Pseudomonas phage 201phi2-1 TaxID=198110 RepID=B3FJ92_BP201|nr:tail fiber protein [Pseudomonas phage 201phi2-1]ABY63059.1 virion structural protein [Pseudomonas phage 201phi2-1]
MADQKKAGMISGMSPLAVLTGDELMEVSSRQPDGSWKTFSIIVSKIRTNAGLSAYEVAVVNGFVGTQAEWLESLNGKSAYQVAVELGYVGTEAEWLESLVGKSAYEDAVAQGYNGTLSEWLNSLKGQSAYQIAVANGFVGTEAAWLESLKGQSAYQLAKIIDPTVGTEEEWLATLVGKSAYQVALDNGFVGTEAAWLKSLEGKSSYQVWLSIPGNEDKTEVEFIEAITGQQGEDGKSAYEVWVELPGNAGKTEAEFFESLKGEGMTQAKLQELLDLGYYTTEGKFVVKGTNSGIVSNAGYLNFLFLFDKRLNNVDSSDPDKVPQRSVEMGRMEAEGYSYWKNSSAPSDEGTLPAVPNSEVRLYDNGHFQIGSLTEYVDFGDGSKVTVVTPAGTNTYDLAEATQGSDGKSAYQIAVDNGFTGTEAEWLLSLKGTNGTNGTDGTDGQSTYQLWESQAGNQGKSEAEFLASIKGEPGESAYQQAVDEGFVGTITEWLASLKGDDGQSAYQLWEALPANTGKSEEEFLTSLEGESAYQVWLGQPGNAGKTEVEFIASLKGARGEQGLSAYQIWINAGNTGSEAEYLASLKGRDGTNGTNGTNGEDGAGLNVVATVSQEDFDQIVQDGTSVLGDAYFVGEFMYVFNGTDWVKSNSLQGPTGKGLNYLGVWPNGQALPLGPTYNAGDTYMWQNNMWTLMEQPTRAWVATGVPGPAGKSAYQVWLEQPGNAGKTEAEYIASLKGDKGDEGDVGPDGLSAYQVWLALPGNAGKTEAEYIASLKGAKGDPAAAFEIVDQLTNVSELPRPGTPANAYYVGKDLYVWFDSKSDYENLGSLDGASAYQIWLENGGVGTEADFLASLKGTDGTNGTNGTNGTDGKNLQVNGTQANEAAIKALPDPVSQDAWVADDTGNLWIYNGTDWFDAGPFRGPKGEDGTDGTDGTNGQSTYELWVEQPGNAGKTEAEFLASLKGADGTDGTNGTDGRNVTVLGGLSSLGSIIAQPNPAQQDAWTAMDTGRLYMYIGTTWTDLGQFRGNPGAQGEQGVAGQGLVIVQEVELLTDLPAASTLRPGDAVYVLEDHKLYQVNDAGVYGPGIQIQGPQGADGEMGPQGPAGTSITIMGSFADLTALQAAHPTGVAGEGYLIGDDLYLYGVNPTGGATEWYNAGPVRGPQGLQGNPGPRGLRGLIGETGERGSLWLVLPEGTDTPTPEYGRSGDWAVNSQFDSFYKDASTGWALIGRLVAGDVNSPLPGLGKVVREGTEWVPLPIDEVTSPVVGTQYVRVGIAGGKTQWATLTLPSAGVPEVPANTTVPQGRTSAGWVAVLAAPTGQVATTRYELLNGVFVASAVQAAAPSTTDTALCYSVTSAGVGSWVTPTFNRYSLLQDTAARNGNFTPDFSVQQTFRINGGTGSNPTAVTLPAGTTARTMLAVFVVQGNTNKLSFVAGTGSPTIGYNNGVAAADIEYGATQTVITAFWNGFGGWIISKGPSY